MPVFPSEQATESGEVVYISADDWINTYGDRWVWIGGAVQPTNWLISATAPTLQQNVSGDFNSYTDKAGPDISLQSTVQAQYLTSPRVFGAYSHVSKFYHRHANVAPVLLNVEFIAQWAINSANEPHTACGLFINNSTPIVDNDHGFTVHSNGANYVLKRGATTLASTVAVDTNPHKFHIYIDPAGNATWDIDDVAQGGSIAVPTDIYPMMFGVTANSGRTNTIQAFYAEVWYD